MDCIGPDGNLYLDDKLYGTTTDKEKSVLRSLTGMLGNGNGGSGSSTSTSRLRENISKLPIDPQASVSKQTIQALRYLFKAGQITRENKELLMLDIIEHVAREETSLLVVAYELLVVKAKDSNQQTRPWSQALVGGGTMSNIQSKLEGDSSISSAGLEEFADQCRALALTLSNRHHTTENDEDEDEDDDELEDYDDDDDDDDDDEEEQEVEEEKPSDRRRGKREPRIVIDDLEVKGS